MLFFIRNVNRSRNGTNVLLERFKTLKTPTKVMRSNFLNYIWTIFTILVVLTWILWFFGYDIRDVKSQIKDSFTNVKDDIELDSNSQQKSSVMPSSQITTPQEDELITKCKASYETCKEVSTQKYGLSISLIKSEKFEDYEKASEFYNTWKGLLQGKLVFQLCSTSFADDSGCWNYQEDKTPIEDFFPIVLFAITTKGPQGQLPVVLVCDSQGSLIEESKNQLLC